MFWWKLCGTLLAVLVARKVFEFRRNTRKFCPLLFLPSDVRPESRIRLAMGAAQQKMNTISLVPILSGTPTCFTRSLDVACQIVAANNGFVKPEDIRSVLLGWGRNLFTENGSEWIRHRRIMNPAFTPEVSVLWCVRLELPDKIRIKASPQLGLLVISCCGFGRPLAWTATSHTQRSASETMQFARALDIVSGSVVPRLLILRWAYRLPLKRYELRDMEIAHRSVDQFMQELIKTRQVELSADKAHRSQSQGGPEKDVFRLMIRASEDEGTLRMSNEELVSRAADVVSLADFLNPDWEHFLDAPRWAQSV
ncbi:Cytochrome P450 [Mycena venus]|uniref:Cytochrome P450 n=1 Tax=Mycena venus TaxID=2733690 RepID=A0A8H6U3N9_9AGAR|nr:Cytochrome P450 [Mycena venus]